MFKVSLLPAMRDHNNSNARINSNNSDQSQTTVRSDTAFVRSLRKSSRGSKSRKAA